MRANNRNLHPKLLKFLQHPRMVPFGQFFGNPWTVIWVFGSVTVIVLLTILFGKTWKIVVLPSIGALGAYVVGDKYGNRIKLFFQDLLKRSPKIAPARKKANIQEEGASSHESRVIEFVHAMIDAHVGREGLPVGYAAELKLQYERWLEVKQRLSPVMPLILKVKRDGEEEEDTIIDVPDYENPLKARLARNRHFALFKPTHCFDGTLLKGYTLVLEDAFTEPFPNCGKNGIDNQTLCIGVAEVLLLLKVEPEESSGYWIHHKERIIDTDRNLAILRYAVYKESA